MKFHGRQAAQIENEKIRVTVLEEGGHIAEILHKESGINPLWIPPWESIEPSRYDLASDRYGAKEEGKLLAGIMGHNLCLDMFGPPSSEETDAGLSVHGEASFARYELAATENHIRATAHLPLSALRVKRTIRLEEDGVTVHFSESVENLLGIDRPIGWTQHVTLAPPFLENGVTRFSIPAERSRVFGPPAFGDSNLIAGANFTWPFAPVEDGSEINLSTFSNEPSSAKFTTHLMDRTVEDVSFTAYNPACELTFGYCWKHKDFPWLGIWEENRSRKQAPWNGKTVACGMEFGVSPFPETRREMLERGPLFDTPTLRWLPARSRISVEYFAFVRR